MDTTITVVTVCFNSEKTIRRTIESVLAQTYSNYEYIVVDGCSTDGTLEILKEYQPLFDGKMRVISEKDNGIYDAMNKGIKLANGQLIGLLNSEDWYEADTLETIANHYHGEKYAVLYGMLWNYLDGKRYQLYMIHHECLETSMLTHSTCFVTRETYLEIGLYDTKFKSSGDYDLFLKFFYDKRVVFLPIEKVLSNFTLGGMSGSIVCKIEDNEIKYKNKIISKKTYIKNKIKYFIKKLVDR